jgi:hypothetical protein
MPYKDQAKRLASAKASKLRMLARLTPEQRRERLHSFPSRSPAARRRGHLKYRYGLTVEQWEAEFDAQGRRCQICRATTSGWKRGWHTDHDHKTGEMRGILCHVCNRTLGHMKEEAGHFQAFIDYLNFHGGE